MRTWSIEECFVRGYSLAAVAAQHILDALWPPFDEPAAEEFLRRDGAEQAAEREADDLETCYFCGDPTGSIIDTDCGAEYVCDKCSIPTEPGLTDDELVAVRGLIQERYETPATDHLAGDSAGAVSDVPRSPAPAHPNWINWAVPAICEALTAHTPELTESDAIRCADELTGTVCGNFDDWQEWREHVGPRIAVALENGTAATPLHQMRAAEQRIDSRLNKFQK
jgi:hypothetical protein